MCATKELIMQWLISLLFALTGATITEDGYVIDRQQKELGKLERIYWDTEYVNKIKHTKKSIYFEPITKRKGN